MRILPRLTGWRRTGRRPSPPPPPVTAPAAGNTPITITMPPSPPDRTQRITAWATVGAVAVSAVALYYGNRSANAALEAAKAGSVQASAAAEQADAAQAAQLTDRYAVAVESLGNASADTRIGAIYALERIMRDSPRDHPAVVSLLATYVRTHSVENRPAKGTTGWRHPRADVQEALRVLGHRDAGGETTPADLSGAFLYGADLRELDLRKVVFSHADLGGARARNVRLEEAHLDGADLDEADLVGARLDRADASGAILDDALLDGVTLRNADLTNASLRRVSLEDVVLGGADLTTADLGYTTFTASTVVSDVTLEGADLRGANLRRARSLDPEALACTTGSAATTLLPPGISLNWTTSSKCAAERGRPTAPVFDFRAAVTKRRSGG
ncbi:pentapeptide repeat-containing protein [Actinoplanes sp. CA-030573]|uniref:pentapeptide repeat-containing protein n=1 Tax=Actinoplanes sp. CA-030573 TaxID=3239898 RepID=UPI003D8DB560